MASNIKFNNTKITKILYNNTDLDKLIYNGTTVFTKDYFFLNGSFTSPFNSSLKNYGSGNGYHSINGNNLVVTMPPITGWANFLYSSNTINLTPYTKLCMEANVTGNKQGGIRLGVSDTTQGTNVSWSQPKASTAHIYGGSSGIFEVDISSYSTNSYITIDLFTHSDQNGSMIAYIPKIWLV